MQFVAILALLLNFCATTCSRNDTTGNMIGYQVIRTIPDITPEGNIVAGDIDTAQAYYYRDATVLRLSYFYSHENANGVLEIDNQLRYRFLAFRKGQQYGYSYDSRLNPEKSKVNLDTALKTEWVVANDLSGGFKRARAQLVRQKRTSDSLIRVYKIYDRITGKSVEDIELGYSRRYPNVDLSICRALDTVTNMKLSYFSHTANPDYMRSQGIKKGVYTSSYYFAKIPAINQSEISRYFEGL